jgi:hypothetical protein
MQGDADGGQHAFKVAHHFAVREADHAIALLFEKNGSARVILAPLGMCSPVQLNGEFGRSNCEIDDIRADRDLPTAFDAFEATPT